jgi:hypothetical protein
MAKAKVKSKAAKTVKQQFAFICPNTPIAHGLVKALESVGLDLEFNTDDHGAVFYIQSGETWGEGCGLATKTFQQNVIVLDASRDFGLIVREVDSWNPSGGGTDVLAAEDFDHGKSYLYPGGGLKVGCKDFTREEADEVVKLLRAGKEAATRDVGNHRISIDDARLHVDDEHVDLSQAKQIANWRDRNLTRVRVAVNGQHQRALEEANHRNRTALAAATQKKAAKAKARRR